MNVTHLKTYDIVKSMPGEKCIDLNMYIIYYNQLSKHSYQEFRGGGKKKINPKIEGRK